MQGVITSLFTFAAGYWGTVYADNAWCRTLHAAII